MYSLLASALFINFAFPNTNMLKFAAGQAALFAGKTLAVADLHLGLEEELAAAGLHIPSQAAGLAEKIRGLVEQNNANEIIINGDLKHEVRGLRPLEEKQIMQFVERIEQQARLVIIKGNHDGLIQKSLPVHAFVRRHGCYFTHGHMRLRHAKPDELVVSGHLHPAVEFRDSLGGRTTERAWIISPTRIIMPAFNPLLGGADVRSLATPKNADVFLLDGLHLGKAGDLPRRDS